jgi:hypothetical protein
MRAKLKQNVWHAGSAYTAGMTVDFSEDTVSALVLSGVAEAVEAEGAQPEPVHVDPTPCSEDPVADEPKKTARRRKK